MIHEWKENWICTCGEKCTDQWELEDHIYEHIDDD